MPMLGPSGSKLIIEVAKFERLLINISFHFYFGSTQKCQKDGKETEVGISAVAYLTKPNQPVIYIWCKK
jgi:hypothetical protein